LLSQTLVAFTIELDNEFEHRMQHRTTAGGGKRGRWLVSLVLWSNCPREPPGARGRCGSRWLPASVQAAKGAARGRLSR
jgi:hypothetical protein